MSAPPFGTGKNLFRFHLEKAESFQAAGDFEASVRHCRSALALAETAGDKISLLSRLGLLHWNLGNIDNSLGFYLRARALAVETDRQEDSARLGDILDIYRAYQRAKEARDAGKFEESLTRFGEAVEFAGKARSPEHEVKCLRQLSASHYALNQMSAFFDLNARAVKLAARTRLRREEGYGHFNLGLYHQFLGHYAAALDSYIRSYEIAVELGDEPEQSACLLNLSAVHLEIGNFERAIEKLEDALEIDRKLGNAARVAQDLNNLGIVYRKKGYASGEAADYERALSIYRRALLHAERSGNRKDAPRILNNIGSVLTDLDRDLEALEHFKHALSEAETHSVNDLVVVCLTNLGIVNSKLGNHDMSIRYYQRSIDMAVRYNKVFLWDAYLEIANTYKKQGKHNRALANYKTAIAVIEDLRSKIDLEEYRAAYLGSDKRLEAYRNLIDLLVVLHESRPEDGYDHMAFHYLERAKARAFLDSLEISNFEIGEGLPARLVSRENEILADISRLHTELLAAEHSPERTSSIEAELLKREEAHEALKREIRRTSPTVAALRYPEIIDVPSARNLLPDQRTAVIAYGIGRERSYGFSLTKKRLKIFPLPDARRLQASLSAYLGELTDRTLPPSSRGRELARMLVTPALEPGIRNLIFVTDDILNYLPFESLPVSDGPEGLLIARFGVSYAPSVSSLRELTQRSREWGAAGRGRKILLVGDPNTGGRKENSSAAASENGSGKGPDTGFPALRFSGREIEDIASLYGRRRADVFLGKDATEALIKNRELGGYRIIHISAHGLVNDRNPARSAVVLSRTNGDREDGFLQMREIFNLRMKAGLVVLSACDTGLGPHIHGEGLQGLNRAFFSAGAGAVLMSLWAVHDEASAQLMARFHFHLRRGERIAEALRRAKMELARSAELSHPYYWAGFVVTGRADRVLFPRFSGFGLLAAAGLLLILVLAGIKLLRDRTRPAA
ncbi:MAG: CHAT domain-containing protein [Candidatus Aminicenantes bacterium]|nr:CHAT domain-containing protein [Candidatus Aminicenantes bacterium]